MPGAVCGARSADSVVTGSRERLDAPRGLYLASRIDAEGAEEGQVIDVDAELDLLVALHNHLGRRGVFFLALLVQTDRGIEHDIEVVAFVADLLNLLVDVIRSGDRFVDCGSQ